MLQRSKQPKQPFTLFQRPGSTIWSVRFSAGGKQIRKSLETDNYDEAHHRAYQIWSEANYRVKNGLTATVRPFHEVAEEFIKLVETESERGDRSKYQPRDWPPVIHRYLVGFFGDKPIDTIREPDIERYIEWRRTYWTTGPGKDIQYILTARGWLITEVFYSCRVLRNTHPKKLSRAYFIRCFERCSCQRVSRVMVHA